MEKAADFRHWKVTKTKVLQRSRYLPCRYRSQLKRWMSSELSEGCARELDRKFGSDKRKIALIINNCEAHSHVEHLEWVQLIFLPLNTTFIMQAMDQRLIRSLKAKYRSFIYFFY